MAKQNINVGTTANDKKGDSLRAAFQKVNTNFTELYAALGLDADTLNIGAFEFTGSVISTTDSSAIVIDQATTITSNLSVGGDIVPQTANGGDLGSSTLPWRSLYVSNNTIYIGGTAVGVDANGALTTGGTVVGSTPAWANITGKPTIPTSFDRIVNGAHELELVVNGATPYVTFPAADGGNIIIQGSEIGTDGSGAASIATLTSAESDVKLSANATATNGPRRNWTFGTDGTTSIPGDIKSNGNINIDINLADSTLRRWSFGEDGILTLPSVGKISNGAYDWTFGSTGITTFPGVINAGNINNLVVNDLGGGTSLTAGSQVQIGNSANDGAGVLIKNSVTNTLGGESSLESGSKIQMDNGNVSLFSYTYNGLGGGEGLEGRLGVEVDNSYLNNVVRIGLRVTNILEEGNTTAFSGWTFHGQSTSLTLPMGAVINETTSSPGLYRTKYSGNFVLDPTWFAANAGNIVNGDSFPEGILQNYDEVSGAFSFQYFGYFVPPTTANYTFRAHADETFIFWIGAKALSGYTYANKDMYGNYNGTFPEQQTQSFTIALTAGQFYPIRIQWANGGGFGELDVFTWANNVGQADTANFTGRVFMENTGTAKIAVNDNKSIILSTDNATDNNWTFAPDGSLTLPPAGKIINNNKEWIFGTDGSIKFPDNTVQTTAAEAFSFSVAADDSTQRLINAGELVKFIGAGGVTTASDAEGNITITGSGGGSSIPAVVTTGAVGVDGAAHAKVQFTVASATTVTAVGVTAIGVTDSTKGTITLSGSPATGAFNIVAVTNTYPGEFYIFIPFATNASGTGYGAPISGEGTNPCLVRGTMITMADMSRVAVENITYGDDILVWDFDLGEFASAKPLWIKKTQTTVVSCLLTFSDHSELQIVGDSPKAHRIFNKEAGKFTYGSMPETPIGTTTFNDQGEEITLISKQWIVGEVEFYNVMTDYHMNLFANSILTSMRYNNLYPITDMKFVKDGRTLRTADDYPNVEERLYKGFRLAEQTQSVEEIETHIQWLLTLEVERETECV